MIFSWLQLGVFFVLSGAVGAFLFPSKYIRGQMQQDRGDRSEAIGYFNEFLSEHPFHRGATLALIRAYEASGRPDAAIEPLIRYYEHRRGDPEAAYRALDLMRHAGMHDKADDFLVRFADEVRRSPGIDRARVEETLFQAYQRALAVMDDKRIVEFLSALRYWSVDKKGYRDELLRHHLARRSYDRAISLLKEEIAHRPESVDPRLLIARVERLRGRPDRAIAELTAGHALIPEEKSFLADRAEILVSLKRWADAAEDYRRLTVLNPREAAWKRELAHSLNQSDRFPEGISILEEMHREAPHSKDRWMAVIYAYTDKKMWKEANDWMARYVERFPNDKQRLMDLVYTNIEAGQDEEATRNLEIATSRFPDDLEALDALIYQYEKTGRPEDAIEALKRYVAKAPADLPHRRALGELLSQEDRTEEAIASYEILVRLAPKHGDYRLFLAYLHENRRDFAKAAAVYEDYIVLFPQDGKAVDKLAHSYLGLGRKDKAVQVLQDYFARTEKAPR